MSLQANLLEFSKTSQESNAVIFKEEYHLKGVEWIPVLLDAIQHHLYIELTYHKFYEEQPESVIFSLMAKRIFREDGMLLDWIKLKQRL
jgi:hypothetical protein